MAIKASPLKIDKIESNGLIDITSNDILSVNSKHGSINIGNNNSNCDINIGTGGNKVVNIGNHNSMLNICSTTFANNTLFNGSIITTNDILSKAPYICLNSSLAYNNISTGGIVLSYDATNLTTDTKDAGIFTPAIEGLKNATVTVMYNNFHINDIIQISGSLYNNGYYEVLNNMLNLLTIKGVGLINTVESFTKKEFIKETNTKSTITKINVAVLKTNSNGGFHITRGCNTPLIYTDLIDSSSNQTLTNKTLDCSVINTMLTFNNLNDDNTINIVSREQTVAPSILYIPDLKGIDDDIVTLNIEQTISNKKIISSIGSFTSIDSGLLTISNSSITVKNDKNLEIYLGDCIGMNSLSIYSQDKLNEIAKINSLGIITCNGYNINSIELGMYKNINFKTETTGVLIYTDKPLYAKYAYIQKNTIIIMFRIMICTSSDYEQNNSLTITTNTLPNLYDTDIIIFPIQIISNSIYQTSIVEISNNNLEVIFTIKGRFEQSIEYICSGQFFISSYNI